MSRKLKVCNFEISSLPILKNPVFSYEYTFSRTKNISLKVDRNRFLISYKIKTVPFFDKTIKSALFFDAITKIFLLHLVLFSETINLEKVQIKIGKETKIIPKENEQIFNSIVNSKLLRLFSDDWKNNFFIEKLLNTSKTNYDSRFSSLFAFIISKSKKYEIERFQNLWIAMNGLYSFYANKMAKGILDIRTKKNKLHSFLEGEQLQLFCFYIELKSDSAVYIKKEDSDSNGNELTEILNSFDYDNKVSKALFLSEKYKKLREKIRTKLNEKEINLSEYTYLIIHYAYYLRCNYFHANKPLPLIYFNQKREWKILKFINDLIEEFLDSNLYKFFTENFIETEKIKIEESNRKLKNKLNKTNKQ